MSDLHKIARRAFGLMLLAHTAAAQSLTLSYRGHDGASAETATLPALATGNLVGKLTMETNLRSLDYVAAYYSSNGNLLSSETRDATGRAWFVYAGNHNKLIADPLSPMQFPITLPIGESGGAQLPIGTFTLRMWVGPVGGMRYDPVTGVPIAGSIGTATTTVTVQDVPYAVYVPSPRNLVKGSQVEFRVLTSRAVSRNVTFRVYPNDAIGTLSATQVMIPRGKTSSPALTLTVNSSSTEGQILVRDDTGAEYRSSMLKTNPVNSVPLIAGEQEPGIDDWAICTKKARWKRYGEGEQVCGNCATNPTSPAECHVAPGQSHGIYEAAECSWDLLDDCELFREDHQGVQTYTASNTYNQSCGSTQWQVDANGQVSGQINGVGGQVGGSVSASGTITKYQKCCIVRHGPLKTVSLVQCRTID